MTENYIKRLQNQLSKRTLLFSLCFFLLSVLYIFTGWTEMLAVFSPFCQINSMADAKKLFENQSIYAHVNNARLYFTDYGVSSINSFPDIFRKIFRNEDELDQIYSVIEYNDGYLFALVPASLKDQNDAVILDYFADVKFSPLYSSSDSYEKYKGTISILAEIYGLSFEEMMQFVPPMMLTINRYGRLEDQLLSAVILLMAIISTVMISVKAWHLADYRKGSLFRQLARMGNPENIECAINLNIEMGCPLYISQSSSVLNAGLITLDYIVALQGGKWRVFPTKQLIWAHLKTIRHKQYFITIAKSQQLVLYFRGLRTPAIITSYHREITPELLDKIAGSLHVLSGYNDELMQLYKKDYPAFLALTDAHRHSFETDT